MCCVWKSTSVSTSDKVTFSVRKGPEKVPFRTEKVSKRSPYRFCGSGNCRCSSFSCLAGMLLGTPKTRVQIFRLQLDGSFEQGYVEVTSIPKYLKLQAQNGNLFFKNLFFKALKCSINKRSSWGTTNLFNFKGPTTSSRDFKIHFKDTLLKGKRHAAERFLH